MGFSVPFQGHLKFIVALLLLHSFACWGQERDRCVVNMCTPSDPRLLDSALDWCVIRSIEDPATHQSWLVVRDKRRPAAPARLVGPRAFPESESRSTEESRVLLRAQLTRKVIHSGDSLIVDQHTSVVDARFEATALSAAEKGQLLTVRLKIGGRIFRVVAVAPGRAELLSLAREARP